MASKVEVKIKLSGSDEANKLMSDEFFTRYMKDDFQERDIIGAYYDNVYEELAAQELRLRVRKINRIRVADLKQGKTDSDGLFWGQQWVCKFVGAHNVVERLKARGAPEIKLTAPLSPVKTFNYKHYIATLYMPDQVRVELSFDIDGDEASLELELLYGASAALFRLADEFRREFLNEKLQ